MKSLFKKPWFIGVLIIALLLVVFLLNLWIMSLKLVHPYERDTIWTLADSIADGGYLNIFSFSLMLGFYISIVPIFLSGLSFFKKNNWGFITATLTFLVFETTLIVFQSFNHYLSAFALVLTIINIVFIVSIFVLLILRNKILIQSKIAETTGKEIVKGDKRIPLLILVIDIAAILVFLTTFVIPLYVVDEYNVIIINVLLLPDANVESIIYFLVAFALFLSIIIYFASTISRYFYDKERFVNQSKTLIAFAFIATLMFFLTGLGKNIYYVLVDRESDTSAYIPLLMMLVVIFGYAVLKGKYSASCYLVHNQEVRIKYPRIEPLFYVVLITAVTVLMLLLPIIKIGITAGSFTDSVSLTGLAILRDYPVLDPGYRIVAYILVVMLISIGLALVIALAAYLSKYRYFNSIVKSVAAVNIFFVFLVAVSGYYFQIANEINQLVLLDIFDFYGVDLPYALEYEYTIGTDAIYALIAAVSVLILMFIRKAFDRDELIQTDFDSLAMNGGAQANGEGASETEDDAYRNFDPCPALSELDTQTETFKQDLENRLTLKKSETSLNELVNFIVDYARNSNLHLSYTPEDIATFVAGLGASRLSILQGMSGTGKTSLPKIFSEAIFGNCEIIEVESSWKDKNELLGYYNEFSMRYTPKKFTLALYKAALNQEICTFILLDEMNLSRIEYYFSDFLSLMENEEGRREIKLVNIKLTRKAEDEEIEYLALTNGTTLKVPANVWFIGTANRDESTFVISDKVYDRAHTMNFTKRAPKVRNYSNPIPQQFYDYQTMNELLRVARQSGDFDAEKNELIKSVESLLAPYNISFGNRILKQIEDFVNVYKACFPNEDVENEAIEKILLSKVVAKLEVKTIDDKEKLELEFEKLNLNQCLDFIKRLDSE